MERTEIHNINEKANSFSGRYGGVGTDFKIYFDTLNDLIIGIENVISAKEHLAKRMLDEVKV